jgi:hypothetical protein
LGARLTRRRGSGARITHPKPHRCSARRSHNRFIGFALLGRTGAPSVVPTGRIGSSTEPRVTFAPKQVKRISQNSSANVRRASTKNDRHGTEELRHYDRGTAARFYVRRNNSFQPLSKRGRTQALDLRLFGRRSNASLERGPPNEAILNSIAAALPQIGTHSSVPERHGFDD